MTSGSAVKALGEVALGVNNLEEMKRFYQEVLGFEVLGEFPSAALLKIAEGYAGHTQVLGLFDRSVAVDQERTTVDHITFTIGLPDYDSERKRLETLGLNVEVKEHEWINWRSLYTRRTSHARSIHPRGKRVQQILRQGMTRTVVRIFLSPRSSWISRKWLCTLRAVIASKTLEGSGTKTDASLRIFFVRVISAYS
jgi:catechol 2,3-dioxygenase-like lactoylglutathione lyase family enzyme